MIRLSGLVFLLVFASAVVKSGEGSERSTGFQGYVDDRLVGSGHIQEAAIFDRRFIHASTSNFRLRPQEMNDIFNIVSSPDTTSINNIQINGNRYLIFKHEEGSIRAKSGRSDVFIFKTVTVVVMSFCKEGEENLEACENATKDLADFLKGSGV